MVGEEMPRPRPAWNWLTICLTVVIVLLGAYIGYGAYGDYRDANPGSDVSPSVTDTSGVSPTASSTPTEANVDRIVDEGVTWITPQALGDLGIVEKKTGTDLSDYVGTKYYKVGSTSSGSEIILAKIEVSGLGSSYIFERFLKKGSQVDWLRANSEDYDLTYAGFTMNYSRTDPIIFESLLVPALIVNGKTRLVKTGSMDRNPDYVESANDKKIGSTEWGDLYESSDTGVMDPRTDSSYEKLAVSKYYIKLNDTTHEQYIPTGTFVRDDNTFDLEYSAATQKASESQFMPLATGGCGFGGGSFPELTDETQLSGKKLLGKSGTSEVYYLDDVNNDIVKFGYEMYKLGREASDIRPIADFVSNFGVIFWKDAYNSTLVYMNTDWAPQVECGKPVIYLYPEKEMQVSVQVGAEVTKSEPEYNNGWSVLAKPNGQLILNGQAYPNLFWEGLGYGQYPAITTGTVVALADVASTIESQLKQMGLNSQEIADFNEFWLPKMPNQPYVRLTWLQNKEMNELAPLKITPVPKSVIRVFLDFQGYDTKITIPAQQLISYPRTGYTAVEWGGLLK